jgi:hypothetical protein
MRGLDLFSVGAAHLESGGALTDGRQGCGGRGSRRGSRCDSAESQKNAGLNVGRSVKSGLDDVRDSIWGTLDTDGFGIGIHDRLRLGSKDFQSNKIGILK